MEALRTNDEKDKIVSSVVLQQGTEGTVSTHAGGAEQVFSENRARFEAHPMRVVLTLRIAALPNLI